MADLKLDVARMVMQTRYEMQLEAEASSVHGEHLSDMERKDYQKRIEDLLNAVTTLLDANNAMGEKLQKLEKIADAYEDLKAEHEKLKGELAMRKRAQHGKGSEKPKDDSSSDEKTKDDDENDYIENGSRNDIPPVEEPEEEDATSSEPPVKKERDNSNRPEHYQKGHADIHVIHDCDLDELERLGYEFIRYTRPVDQFDRVSITRQDTYRYVWVRDKKTGREFAFFVPKKEKRECIFVNESDYDEPRLVPHTSCTWRLLSDVGVNRYQYALSCGREMYRMVNEKMKVAPQTILNWLKEGAEFLKGGMCRIKRRLLKKGTAIYVDETWIDTKVKQPDGSFKYVKRYMWVIVNLTTKVCYYLFGRRRREVIEKFLGDFQGTLMTDAYNAYAYFNKLDGCTHACCWAHVRRIFWSALKDYKDLFAQEYINKIGILYKVELESILLHRTEAEVLEARQLESIPILNELDQDSALLLAKVKSKELKISSKLEKALNYMRNHWKELIAYIDIGNVLIDNNCCERAVRPFTNLRKSFGGFSSELGGEVAAAWLTFVESCKLQKKAALEVFNGYFQRIAEGRRDYDLITEEVLC
ncbi:MAG: IS66 family transposase [Prevotella sp.]|nr:IS66 family transposase [Prevotella sp.]MBP3844005.1 IS66 family transposase [Prevotella sp.]